MEFKLELAFEVDARASLSLNSILELAGSGWPPYSLSWIVMMKKWFVVFVIAVAAVWLGNRSEAQNASGDVYRGWTTYGGGTDNIHYSSLQQINRTNVSRLSVAWSYDTQDTLDGSDMQCNPVIVDGVLYATSPKLRVFALDAATGKERWSFDPNQGQRARRGRSRGVTYWESGRERRIFFGHQHWLYALDAQTGQQVKDFGEAGRVDLRVGLGRDPQSMQIGLTTPGVIYQDLLIIGSIVNEGLPAAPGHIRAYDVRTGQLRWTFHTIPQPGEYGYETWPKDAWKYTGGANAWSGMALDVKRGLVYVPTGSAAFDFYGANRHGDNLFANTLLCLEAKTGKRKWHFQIVRHDVWDRDLPAAPTLITVNRNGRSVDAVAQATKSGHVFVFERETGQPVFPIEYRKTSDGRSRRRKTRGDTALPVLAAAGRAAGIDRGYAYYAHPGGARRCAETVPPAQKQWAIRAAEHRRNHCFSRF